MRTLVNITIAIMVMAGSLVFGQDAKFSDSVLKSPVSRRDASAGAFRSSPKASAKADSIRSYFTGSDFEDVKHYIEEGSTSNAIVSMAYLWDGLAGKPEAAQIEALLQTLLRGGGTAEQKIIKLETVQTAVETRLKGEQKWYYNLGKSYGQVQAYECFGDETNVKLKLSEIGNMAKTAPNGTPTTLVNALSKVGEYGAKPSLSKDDWAGIGTQWESVYEAMKA